MSFLNHLLELPVFTLFAIIALGMWFGSFKVHGLSLGAAGVLFIALFFGHFKHTVPKELTDIGLLLFVYAVGLQAGPRFVSIFRVRGKAFLLVGVTSTAISALVTIGLAKLFHFSPPLAAGLYAGANTCTPALAGAMDAIRNLMPGQENTASVGYGIAYPFSVMGVVLLIQTLPALLRVRPEEAAEEAREEEAIQFPGLSGRQLRITNPHFEGQTIRHLQDLNLSTARISRVKREDQVMPAHPDTTLRLNDVVHAVGTEEEVAKLNALLGEVAEEIMTDPTGNVISEEVLVSREEAISKPLGALRPWERFNVVVTRVRREGIELTPTETFVLEPGDLLRVVGAKADLDAFAHAVGKHEERLKETGLLPFAGGLALGIAIGNVPIPLPGGMHTQLGMGGGAFLAALLLGHLGHIGPIPIYVPQSARNLARELGLVIFLAGAGSGAGSKFMEVLRVTGPQALLAGAIITVVTVGIALFLMHRVLRWNLLTTAGALCSCMTNPPGLNAATRLARSDAAAVAFASVYPVALISKIILAQAIFLVLRAMGG